MRVGISILWNSLHCGLRRTSGKEAIQNVFQDTIFAGSVASGSTGCAFVGSYLFPGPGTVAGAFIGVIAGIFTSTKIHSWAVGGQGKEKKEA